MKNILIIFPFVHLSFSPFTLNLYDILSDSFNVTILTYEPDFNYSSHKIQDKNIVFLPHVFNPYRVNARTILKKINKKLKLRERNFFLLTENALPIIRFIKHFEGEIIAVDFFALWCVMMAGKKAHLLSLEITDNDVYRDQCPDAIIKSIIIQSEERYRYLFKEKNFNTFIVQNSPIYIDEKIDIDKRERNKLIFCGSAVPGFGIFNCLEFIEDFPQYHLTIKGAVPINVLKVIEQSYSNLLEQNRLTLHQDYLTPYELNSFISSFRIGFVFYDYFRYDYINTFNYKTAPSGKLFQYYNAGIPVISNDIPGLSSIKNYQTGVMIRSMGSVTIKQAIDQIELDYRNYATRAKELSAQFDFSKDIAPFVDYLMKSVLLK